MFKKIQSLYLSFICAAISAGSIVVIQYVNGSLDSLSLGFIRLVITAVTLLPFIMVKKEYYKLNKRDVFWFIAIALVGYTGNTVFYFLSLLYAPGLNVALITISIPLMTLFFMFLFFKKKPIRQDIVAFFLASIGVGLIITQGSLSFNIMRNSFGEILALLSSLSWVFYTMMIWQLKQRYSATFIVCIGSLLGAVFMVPWVWWHDALWETLSLIDKHWLSVLYVSLFGSNILYLVYIRSVHKVGPSLTAFGMYSVRPLMVAALAAYFLGSGVSWWQVGGGFFIIFSLYLVTYKK